ncbi:MAG: hypothetical protein OK455_06885, partial [Thaumarchaeota archaeon]|nr:hypothetical protein [Nitrososphaerota archaeon]
RVRVGYFDIYDGLIVKAAPIPGQSPGSGPAGRALKWVRRMDFGGQIPRKSPLETSFMPDLEIIVVAHKESLIRAPFLPRRMFLLDEGSVFNGPLDKIWALNSSEGKHNHASLRNMTSEMDGERVVLTYEAKSLKGDWERHKVRLTFFPPVGTATEALEGPRAGSKSFQFYTPQGSKTAITVVGNFVRPGMSDSELKAEMLLFLENLFQEDQTNLVSM